MNESTKNRMRYVIPGVAACFAIVAVVGVVVNASLTDDSAKPSSAVVAELSDTARRAEVGSGANSGLNGESGPSGGTAPASASGSNATETKETTSSDGSRTVTVTYADGSTATITIKNEDGSAQQVSQGQGGSGTGAGGQSSGESATGMTYEAYCALSGDEQYAYYQSFASTADFFAWYNAAKAAYQEANPSIEIGSGAIIDLGGK